MASGLPARKVARYTRVGRAEPSLRGSGALGSLAETSVAARPPACGVFWLASSASGARCLNSPTTAASMIPVCTGARPAAAVSLRRGGRDLRRLGPLPGRDRYPPPDSLRTQTPHVRTVRTHPCGGAQVERIWIELTDSSIPRGLLFLLLSRARSHLASTAGSMRPDGWLSLRDARRASFVQACGTL